MSEEKSNISFRNSLREEDIIINFTDNLVKLFSKKKFEMKDYQNLIKLIKTNYQYFLSPIDSDKINKISRNDSIQEIENKIIFYIHGIGIECEFDPLDEIMEILGYEINTVRDHPLFPVIEDQFILLFILLYNCENIT
jgi:hypothetical protein